MVKQLTSSIADNEEAKAECLSDQLINQIKVYEDVIVIARKYKKRICTKEKNIICLAYLQNFQRSKEKENLITKVIVESILINTTTLLIFLKTYFDDIKNAYVANASKFRIDKELF